VAKIDFKKEFKELYQPSAKQPSIVQVPAMNFLMIDGAGDPNTSQQYQEAMQALYGMAFTLKFMIKGADGPDWVIPPLEGLWWMHDMAEFDLGAKDDWLWTSMIMQPETVTEQLVEAARAQLKEKKDPAALPQLRFENFDEGRCAQIMHIGPYDAEGPTIAKLHEFIAQKGHQLRGKHHEIYLSDPRRAAPEKLKTILRQPVA